MDQEPLVTEQIEAGRKFIDEFEKYRPLQAAFWLKETEDSGWYLYVASDQITDGNFDVAYGDVAKAARDIHDPNLDIFRVNVLGIDDPRAKAALEIYRQFPGRVPTRPRASHFGPLGAEAIYLYPPPVAAANK
jgi:hypothetical protein